MAVGLETDFKIYSPQFWGGVVETLQQYTDVFNTSSNGALRLVTRNIIGDYERESFLKNTAGIITRRDPTSQGQLTDSKLVQGEFLGVKINRRIGPFAQTLDAWKKVGLDPQQFSLQLGQQTGPELAADYVNSAIAAVRAAISSAAVLQYDATSDTVNTSNYTALVNGLSKFGDAANRISAWVMHSKSYFDLMKNSIADKIFDISNVTIYAGTVASLGRPIIVTDTPALITPAVTGSNPVAAKYDILGLTENAVEVAESEEKDVISQPVTGYENLAIRIQGEYAFNLRVKGCAWNLTGTGINPTDTAVATSSNWIQQVADVKNMPGVRITTF